MSQKPTIFVTGATGQLGALVIDELLQQPTRARIIAGVRDVGKAERLRDQGVELRIADYSRPETLMAAFAGVDRLLLISGTEIGQRKAQHRNAIRAAKEAGVSLVAYTSILRANTSPLFLAEEHRDTEAALAESGVPHVLLRNGWYNEVFTWRLPPALKEGVLAGSAGEGRISSAARADYAKAAAEILRDGDHAGRIYELAGDAAFTLTELAAIAGEAAGKPVSYLNMAPEAFRAAAVEAGTPEVFAKILSDTDAGVEKGALFDDASVLSRLIGRPTTAITTTIARFINDRTGSRQAGMHG